MGTPLSVKRYLLKQHAAQTLRTTNLTTLLQKMGQPVPDDDSDEYSEWVDAVTFVADRL